MENTENKKAESCLWWVGNRMFSPKRLEEIKQRRLKGYRKYGKEATNVYNAKKRAEQNRWQKPSTA